MPQLVKKSAQNLRKSILERKRRRIICYTGYAVIQYYTYSCLGCIVQVSLVYSCLSLGHFTTAAIPPSTAGVDRLRSATCNPKVPIIPSPTEGMPRHSTRIVAPRGERRPESGFRMISSSLIFVKMTNSRIVSWGLVTSAYRGFGMGPSIGLPRNIIPSAVPLTPACDAHTPRSATTGPSGVSQIRTQTLSKGLTHAARRERHIAENCSPANPNISRCHSSAVSALRKEGDPVPT